MFSFLYFMPFLKPDEFSEDTSSSLGLTLSQRGKEFIAQEEGLRLKIYKDSAGLPTIGIGHLIKSGEDFSKGITKKQAYDLFDMDIKARIAFINKLLPKNTKQAQFDAMFSLMYNIGNNAFKNSTLLKKHLANDFYGTADEFTKWNKAGGRIVQGLVLRRIAERRLFLSEVYK